ncbi:Zinc finger protein ubi-d4 [Blomia tropicalis]|nr:Zinc finger protein ubi-d4 [Blomia tropicalis]
MSAEDKIQISEELLTRLKNYMNDPVYKETVENSSSYNERLVKERKLRLPFIDAQTGVAQSDCYIWSNKLDRMPGYYSAQLYSYPARRWRKKRRQYLMHHSYNSTKESEQSNCESTNNLSHETNVNNATASFTPNSSGLIISQNGNGVNCTANSALNDTFDDSKDSWMRDYDDGSDLPDAGELDDPESDFDDYEEYSSRKKKSKRKESLKKRRPDYSDAEKPYQCDLCGARYKTRPGLSYHYSHSHQDSGNGSLSGNGISEEEKEIIYNSAKVSSSQPGNNGTNINNSSNTSNNNNHAVPNHLSHPNSMNMPSNATQPPLPPPNSAPNNHLQSNNNNSSSKPFESTVDNDKKDPKNSSTRGANTPQTYCDFCLGDSTENKKTNSAEELVSCSDCGRSAHPSCLQFTANMILSVKKYRWQCIECKSCGLCGTSDNDDQLLFCDDCDRGYHMYCLKPPMTEAPEGSWSCHLCIVEYHTPKHELK